MNELLEKLLMLEHQIKQARDKTEQRKLAYEYTETLKQISEAPARVIPDEQKYRFAEQFLNRRDTEVLNIVGQYFAGSLGVSVDKLNFYRKNIKQDPNSFLAKSKPQGFWNNVVTPLLGYMWGNSTGDIVNEGKDERIQQSMDNLSKSPNLTSTQIDSLITKVYGNNEPYDGIFEMDKVPPDQRQVARNSSLNLFSFDNNAEMQQGLKSVDEEYWPRVRQAGAEFNENLIPEIYRDNYLLSVFSNYDPADIIRVATQRGGYSTEMISNGLKSLADNTTPRAVMDLDDVSGKPPLYPLIGGVPVERMYQTDNGVGTMNQLVGTSDNGNISSFDYGKYISPFRPTEDELAEIASSGYTMAPEHEKNVPFYFNTFHNKFGTNEHMFTDIGTRGASVNLNRIVDEMLNQGYFGAKNFGWSDSGHGVYGFNTDTIDGKESPYVYNYDNWDTEFLNGSYGGIKLIDDIGHKPKIPVDIYSRYYLSSQPYKDNILKAGYHYKKKNYEEALRNAYRYFIESDWVTSSLLDFDGKEQTDQMRQDWKNRNVGILRKFEDAVSPYLSSQQIQQIYQDEKNQFENANRIKKDQGQMNLYGDN